MAPLLIFAGCASIPPAQKGGPAQAASPAASGATPARPSSISAEALGIYRTPEAQRQPPTDDELAVIASAQTLLGKPPNASVVVNGRPFVLDCIGTVSAIYYRLWIDVTRDFSRYSGNGVNRLYMTLKAQNVLHADRYPRPGDVIVWDNTWDANVNGDRTDDLKTHAGIVLAVDEDGTIHLLSGDVFNTFGDVLTIKGYFLVEHAEGEEGGSRESMEMALNVP